VGELLEVILIVILKNFDTLIPRIVRTSSR